MSISEINEIKLATNYALNSANNKSAKDNIVELFENKQFCGSGISSLDSFEKEINTLQNFISAKNNAYKQKNTELNNAYKDLQSLNKQLEDEIYEVIKLAEKEEKTQREQIQKAIKEVNQMYMNGDIEKDEMASKLSNKISDYSSLSSNVKSKTSGLNNIKTKISTLTGKIASIIDSANSIESEINIASGTMMIMQNFMDKLQGNNSEKTAENNPQEEASSDSMYVLMDDNQSDLTSQMLMPEDNETEIDYSSLTSSDFSTIENSQNRNIFAVNTVSGVSEQSFENNITDSIGNSEIEIEIDDEVLNEAKNIFAKGLSLSAQGLESNIAKASISINSAKVEINKKDAKISENNRTASSGLTKQERPKTKKEREEQQAEQARKIKAQKEKEAQEAERAKKEREKKEKELKEQKKKEAAKKAA